jgi:ribosomal protein S21
MVEVRKKEGESGASLLYRFSKKIKQSGVLREAKKRRFSKRPVTKRQRRLSALHREQKRKKFEQAKKLGIL